MTTAYGLFNEANGAPRRAVLIIDKAGVVRFREEYTPGNLPDVNRILEELDNLEYQV